MAGPPACLFRGHSCDRSAHTPLPLPHSHIASTNQTPFLPQDRFDYANDHWAPAAKKFGALTTDPPLSALGHRQAKETADYLVKTIGKVNGSGTAPNPIAKVMVSPYLRVIQTACPTSDAFGVLLSIEYGLSEAHATPGNDAALPEERFAYFPHVDPTYQSLHQVESTPGFTCPKTGHPCEAFAGHYTKRMRKFAEKIEEHHQGRRSFASAMQHPWP